MAVDNPVSGTERRENRTRVRFKAHFYCKCLFDDGQRNVSAVAKDISMAGVRVLLNRAEPISSGEKVLFYLLFPDQTIRVRGQAVWVREYPDRKELGIVFCNIADSDKEEIYRYIFKYYREEVTSHWWALPAQ